MSSDNIFSTLSFSAALLKKIVNETRMKASGNDGHPHRVTTDWKRHRRHLFPPSWVDFQSNVPNDLLYSFSWNERRFEIVSWKTTVDTSLLYTAQIKRDKDMVDIRLTVMIPRRLDEQLTGRQSMDRKHKTKQPILATTTWCPSVADDREVDGFLYPSIVTTSDTTGDRKTNSLTVIRWRRHSLVWLNRVDTLMTGNEFATD